MPKLAMLQALDWTRIGREALDAAAATLAEDLRRRLPDTVPTDAIRHDASGDDRASVTTSHGDLTRAELGTASASPMPWFAPSPHMRDDMMAAFAKSVKAALS